MLYLVFAYGMDTILILCETGEDKSWDLDWNLGQKHAKCPVRVIQ
jgi:hypothetical protein